MNQQRGSDLFNGLQRNILNLDSKKLRKMSILTSIKTAPNDCHKCIDSKGATQNLHELRLSQRFHRWPKIRKIQKETFEAYLAEIEEKEIEMLEALDFPDIDQVRIAYIERTPDQEGSFTITRAMERAMEEIWADWLEETVGTELAEKQVDQASATLPYWARQNFTAASDKYYNEILKSIPDWMSEDDIARAMLDISEQNQYLQAVIRDGATRIKAELSKEHLREIMVTLRKMGREGKHPLSAARYLHKMAGEGKAWWWLRITRSESTLAVGSAFDNAIQAYNIPYEYWDAAAGACEICDYFDGQEWKAGTGPRPVVDTHPFVSASFDQNLWIRDKSKNPGPDQHHTINHIPEMN